MAEKYNTKPNVLNSQKLLLAMWKGGGDDESTARNYREHGGNWGKGGSREYDPDNDGKAERELYRHGGEIPLLDPKNDPEWHPGKK